MNDYRSRLITENKELMDRLSKLRNFINSSRVRDLDNREQVLLIVQEQAMSKYHDVLEERLARS